MEGRKELLTETIRRNVKLICKSNDPEIAKIAADELFALMKKINKCKIPEGEMLLESCQHYMREESFNIDLAFKFYFFALKIFYNNQANLNTTGLRVLFDKLVETTDAASSHTLFFISHCYFHGWGPEKNKKYGKKYYYAALPRLWQEWQTESLCGKALFQKLCSLEEFSKVNMGFLCKDGYVFSENGCDQAPLILATMKAVVAQLKGLLLAFQGNILSRTKKKDSMFSTTPLGVIYKKLQDIHDATAKEIFAIVIEIVTLKNKYPDLKEAFQPFVDFNIKPLALQQLESRDDTLRLPLGAAIRLNLNFLSSSKPGPLSPAKAESRVKTSTTGMAGPTKTT